jgi:hypothetical protein
MNQHNGTTALAAGSLDFNGPLEFYEPRGILLAINSGSGESSSTQVVTIRVPSSQLRVKGSVFFVPAAGNALTDINSVGTIWVAACEEDVGGAAGGAGRLVPVTDLEGSAVAGTPVGAPGPTPFPKTDGLGGYAREFVTAAPWLQFTILLHSISTPGAWVFRSSIQPDATQFTWPQWMELRRAFSAQLLTSMGNL